MAKMCASFKSSSRHEEVKIGDRIRKETKRRKINFDADNKVPRFECKGSVFKELMNSGPYCICVARNRNLYKKSMVLFYRDKYSVISDDVFRHVKSFDGKSYMCKTSAKKFKKNVFLVKQFATCLSFLNYHKNLAISKDLKGS